MLSLSIRSEAIAVRQMGRLRREADCEVLLAFVAESALLLAFAAPILFFVATLFRLAIAGMPDGVAGFADIGSYLHARAYRRP